MTNPSSRNAHICSIVFDHPPRGSPIFSTHQDRAAGALLGLAAGDRIGGPIRMALRVAESLIDRRGYDVADVAARYLAWWREGAFDTGPTAGRVLRLAASGLSFDEASRRVDEEAAGMTAGCNPAHRIAPIAMCALIEDASLSDVAEVDARLTHRHPLAGDVAAAVACLCRALIRGTPWPLALQAAAVARSPVTRRGLETRPLETLSKSGFAPDALAAAIHFVGTSDALAVALERSIAFAGPSNYCPVLVGALAGARWGASRIENASLRHVNALLPRIQAAAAALAEGWKSEQ
ncbi:MAG: ADP-ribosylglycohydrolase family protein [Isosphaeraceae bacterium]|nr:ADP-ribosylglycohydrolase family protein [Isosphaeraceae bacterium]